MREGEYGVIQYLCELFLDFCEDVDELFLGVFSVKYKHGDGDMCMFEIALIEGFFGIVLMECSFNLFLHLADVLSLLWLSKG